MTTGHKLLIAAGAMVIVGMMLIVAFALGAYVGEHGWTRDGLALRGPGDGPGKPPLAGDPDKPPPTGPDVPGRFPPLPGGGRRPELVGRIRDIFDGTLVLATGDGPRTVELDERTRVETTEGEPRSLDDLECGQHVAVFGHRNGDGRVLVVELLAAKAAQLLMTESWK